MEKPLLTDLMEHSLSQRNTPSMEAMEGELEIPTPDDFHDIALLQTKAFAEKFACVGQSEGLKDSKKTYQIYHQKFPRKIEHCRVIRSAEGLIIAACQLQVAGDPGDLGISRRNTPQVIPRRSVYRMDSLSPRSYWQRSGLKTSQMG
jgi:hypothetical protein